MGMTEETQQVPFLKDFPERCPPARVCHGDPVLIGTVSRGREPRFPVWIQANTTTSPGVSYPPRGHRLTWQEPPYAAVSSGRLQAKERPLGSVPHDGPDSPGGRMRSGRGPTPVWGSGKENLRPGPSGPERGTGGQGPLGPGRGDDVTHLRDLFAILQVPHRRGLGGDAGQPPPASGERSLSETLPPLLPGSFPQAAETGPQARSAQGQRD